MELLEVLGPSFAAMHCERGLLIGLIIVDGIYVVCAICEVVQKDKPLSDICATI